jgi:hypothetical protein
MGQNARESAYRLDLCKRIEKLLPDCVILRLPPDQYQGIPDLLILFEDKWASLEVKMAKDSDKQPNQDFYVELFNNMSFASFIYPDIEEQVLQDLVEKMGAS